MTRAEEFINEAREMMARIVGVIEEQKDTPTERNHAKAVLLFGNSWPLIGCSLRAALAFCRADLNAAQEPSAIPPIIADTVEIEQIAVEYRNRSQRFLGYLIEAGS